MDGAADAEQWCKVNRMQIIDQDLEDIGLIFLSAVYLNYCHGNINIRLCVVMDGPWTLIMVVSSEYCVSNILMMWHSKEYK